MGFGKDGKGVIFRQSTSFAIGALANLVAVKSTALAITDDFRMIKTVYTALITGLTAGEGTGLHLYLVNADLSVAQIAEALITNGPLNSSDRDKAEEAERFVKLLGSTLTTEIPTAAEQIMDERSGPVMEKTIRWSFNKGVGWEYAIFNNSGSALTTGATLRLLATHYGVWI